MDHTDASSEKVTQVYKKQEYEAYLLWCAMPAVFRGQPRHVLEKLGIEDEIMIELLEIKNQTEFARRFGIKDLGTLSAWNKRIEAGGGLMPHIHVWAKRLTPNVMAALYREVTKTGRAAEVRTWMDLIEGT